MTSSTSTGKHFALETHHQINDWSDRLAFGITRSLRFLADTFFAKRYGNRAIVLETIAAVPGMVGGALIHLRCLRLMRHDHGWIRALMDEAENERMHLMTFIEIARPNWLERMLVMVAQALFFTFFLVLYLLSSRTAHRLVGYFEEQAVISYTQYLAEIDAGRVENVAAPRIALNYWDLPEGARLRDVVIAVRADEAEHREVNHAFADILQQCGQITSMEIVENLHPAPIAPSI
ncbi:MAG: ubiquinol oxidase 1b, mitochondrial-like [Xanthomonadaceae bacterium]|nr:ubiquinol oxidase 1b, mitochondrial-like [Xanthomonadaceae bacterium]